MFDGVAGECARRFVVTVVMLHHNARSTCRVYRSHGWIGAGGVARVAPTPQENYNICGMLPDDFPPGGTYEVAFLQRRLATRLAIRHLHDSSDATGSPAGDASDGGAVAAALPSVSVLVRNRRYQKMVQLLREGTYFSDDAMEARAPSLFHRYVSRHRVRSVLEQRRVDGGVGVGVGAGAGAEFGSLSRGSDTTTPGEHGMVRDCSVVRACMRACMRW